MLYAGKSFWATITGGLCTAAIRCAIGVFATSIMFVAGNVRWLVAPTDMTSLAMIFTLSVIDALYILKLMRAYGRGGPL
jgi:hypothetical protein